MKRTLYFAATLLLAIWSATGQVSNHELNAVERQKLQLPALPQNAAQRLMTRASSESPDYTKGTFVVNEDWYGHQNSSVNFLSSEEKWTLNALQQENPGHELGATAQFGTIYGGKFYIVSKQDRDPGASIRGSRLAVCDAKTMKLLKEFPNIATNSNGESIADGRSFLGVDKNKGYIGTSNGIYVYDINKMEIGEVIPGTGGSASSLYTNQIGSMLHVNNRVFAVHQKLGLLVINPETNKLDTTILVPQKGWGLGSIVLSKDGTVWASVAQTNGSGAADYFMWKINPTTLQAVKVPIPTSEGIETIPNSWYAWTADGFCASKQENKLYWNGYGSGSWFAGYRIFCYDIDKQSFYKVFDFTKLDGDWRLYGTGFRIDPVNDDMYCFLYHSFGDSEHLFIRIATDGQNETNGTVKGKYPYDRANYWFPALPVFPDNDAPTVTSKLPATITLSGDYNMYSESLNEIITDNDNMVSAVIVSVDNDRPDLIKAEVAENKLTIIPLKIPDSPAVINLHFSFNSNGKVVEHATKITLGTTTIPFKLNKKSLTMESNEQQEVLSVTCSKDETVTWSTTDETIATVDKGIVTTHSPGTVNITAKSETREHVSDTCLVTVKGYVKPTLIQSLAFVNPPATIHLGETIKLTYKITPDNATNRKVSLTTSNAAIVGLEGDSAIAGLKIGNNITIQISSSDGTYKKASFRVSCIGPDLQNVSLADTLYGSKFLTTTIAIPIPLVLKPVNANTANLKLASTLFENNVTPAGWTVSLDKQGLLVKINSDNVKTPVDTKATFTLTNGVDTYILPCHIVYGEWINSFSIDEHKKTLKPQGTYDLKKHETIDRGAFTEAEKPVIYSSSDTKVVAVNTAGLITAMSAGTAVVTARIADGSFKEELRILVLGKKLAGKITISPKTLKLKITESHQLTAVLDPKASVQGVTWHSEYPDEISVTDSGEVYAVKAGRVNIIVTSADGAVSDTCVVEAGIPLDRFAITPKELSLDNADAVNNEWEILKKIKMTCYPGNASVIAASGSSGIIKQATASDTNVLTNVNINLYGPYLKLTGNQTGSSYLILETKESGIKDSLRIFVTDRSTGITGVALEKEKTVTTGDVFTIQASVATTEGSSEQFDKRVVWETDNCDVLTVDEEGLFTAKKQGVAIVRAITKVGGFTTTCRVTVNDILNEGITLDKDEQTLYEGEYFTLNATIVPANTTNKKIIWATTNAQVATVNDGEVTAVRAGTVKIIAFTDGGNHSARCILTVLKPKPVVTDNGGNLALMFSRTHNAAWYVISVYKYVNDNPVLHTIYKTDDQGQVLSGKASLKSADYYKINLLTDRWNAGDYIVTATAYESNDESKMLNAASSDKVTIDIATAGELINAGTANVYYAKGTLHLQNLEGCRCCIVGMTGRVLGEFNIYCADEQRQITLEEGVYAITATDATRQFTKKVIVRN